MHDAGRRRTVFAVVTAAYLAVTVAESVLAPLFPAISEDLGLDVATAGVAFGLLTGSIAIGNLVGGVLLSRSGVKAGLVVSLLLAAAGSTGAALAPGTDSFILAQTLIGTGAGVFFVPGIDAAGRAADQNRRGFAMGLFGVAFSAGLAVAALLAAGGARIGWRSVFWTAAAICLVSAGVAAVTPLSSGPGLRPAPPVRVRRMLAVPTTVGAVGTVSQYGTVGFLALYAVTTWDVDPAVAALVVAMGRILSVPGKLVVGVGADRWGSGRTLTALSLCLGATGLVWTLSSAPLLVIPAAVVYVAAVSGLFPIANLLAIEGFAGHGGMLGTYRSVQIAVGAAAAWAMGAISSAVGLRPTLVVTAALPLVLLTVARARSEVAAT